VGAQAGEQFNGLKQIRLAYAVAPQDQQPRRLQLQLQGGDIAEVKNLQATQPDGSGA
jgi:hypothetical protein